MEHPVCQQLLTLHHPMSVGPLARQSSIGWLQIRLVHCRVVQEKVYTVAASMLLPLKMAGLV